MKEKKSERQKNMKKTISKIAHRDIIVGTFQRLISPKGKYALVCHTDRGVIVDYDRIGRRAYYLKRVDAPRLRARGRLVYKVQFTKDDIEALLEQYDHLVFHLGAAPYPYCVVTRDEFLRLGVSVGGCIEVVYQRGNRKFRVADGAVRLDQPMLIEVRRFWHCGQADETVFATAA